MRRTATFLMVGWAFLQGSVPGYAQEVELFNGRDLSGWEAFLTEEGARMEDVWSVRDGVLMATGDPQGYLYTTGEYESYKLVVEWRWPGEPGNSGVLLRVTPDTVMLPSSIEAQLRSGRAGDMYGFQGFPMEGNPDRLSEISIGWSLPRIQGGEKEPGEWNRYEITVDGDRITLAINGVVVNEAWNCEVRPGRIALQSEGAEIHFRTVTLTPLVQATRDERAARVDALFSHLDRPDSPGLAVAVVQDGEVLLNKGYGSANLEYQVPITSTTVFDIASVSKQFAGMAVAMLVEDGTISLDDDVRMYLPELPDFGHVITIDHLVHHTSGIRDWPGTLAVAGWRMDDVIAFHQILRMAYNQEDLNFEPGAEYTYSNTGFNLLAEVVARVSGQSFREWTAENIFDPLGMTDTHFQDDHTEVIPNRAYGYQRTGEGEYATATNLLTALGSSSLFTTVDDLAKWLNNFDDPVVGGPEVMDLMRTQGQLNDGTTIAYAFGISMGEYRERLTASHSGSWAAFRTYLLHFPEERLGLVVLGNHSDFNSTAWARRLADIYLGVEEGAPSSEEEVAEESTPVPVSTALLEDYVGTYRLGPGWYVHIEESGDSLTTRATGESTFPMTARSQAEFWVQGYGASITFQRDDSGKITHFLYRGMEAPRVSAQTQAPPSPLSDFVGSFVSDELNTDYEVAVEEGSLVARHRRHGSIRLTLAWGDSFRTDAWFIQSLDFQRGPDGAVSGFLVNAGPRVRNLRFSKR